MKEAAKRLALEAVKREDIVPDLRKQSRRDYLLKRTDDQIIALEQDIKDDEFLFEEEKLTAGEKKKREYNKTILKLVREHGRAGEIEKVQRYRMPEERRGKEDFVYEEVDEKERVPNSEQRKWEEEQMGFATLKFGAKDARKRRKQKEYEIILDDEIEFVQALKMPGTRAKKVFR